MNDTTKPSGERGDVLAMLACPTDQEIIALANAVAVLARTRQFFGGEDDYWDWDDGEPFDKGALDAAIKDVTELLAADDECDQCEAAWHEAQTNSSGDESPGWWEKEAKRRWQKLGRARKRRAAAIKAFNVVR